MPGHLFALLAMLLVFVNASAQATADLIVEGRYVVTMNDALSVIEDGTVVSAENSFRLVALPER